MKKILSLFLAAALAAALCAGCAGTEKDGPETTGYSAMELAAALLESQSGRPEFYYVTQNDSVFAAYAALYLGEDLAGSVKSGAICYPVGPLASEAAVFEMDSEASAKEAPEPMAGYLSTRVTAFYGYAPEEAELAENGQIRVLGNYAILFILAGADAADKALEDAFSKTAPTPPALDDYATPLHELEEPDDFTESEPNAPAVSPVTEPTEGPTEPEITEPESTGPKPTAPKHTEPKPTGSEPTEPGPAVPDEYDHDKVLAALRGEADPAALMPKNRAVYEAVAKILAEIVTADMTAYEKELAVNDYLVFHAEYDPAELSSGPVGVPDPDNDNPYGLLIKGVGICLGYANTFQLIMDALKIECLTVRGYAHGWSEDHAWNLVNLDGDWYAVDVTWNDPVFTGWTPDMSQRLYYAHSYFNVTSDYLRETEHYWRGDVPEAEGTRWAYR